MKNLKYYVFCLYIIVSCTSVYSLNLGHENDLFEGNSAISRVAIQETSDENIAKFLESSAVRIDYYLDKVIVYKSSGVVFNRSKTMIINDLKNIINSYLEEFCADSNVKFEQFSPSILERINNIDIGRSEADGAISSRVIRQRLETLKSQLNIELASFSDDKLKSEEIMVQKYVQLIPIEPPPLEYIPEDLPPLIDPRTGTAIVEDQETGDDIKNRELIELLTLQLNVLKEELILVKRENLEHDQEFKDIHERLEGLEAALVELRNSNNNATNPTPIEKVPVYKDQTIYFDKNSISIAEGYNEMLRKAVLRLNQNKDLKIIITGHADKSGNAKLNAEISRKRALVVRKYFERKGIERERLLMNFLGDQESSKETRSDRKVRIEWMTM